MTDANVIPGRYRGVAVARVDVPLDEPSLRAHFLGREAYFKTRFLVVRPHGTNHPVAILGVHRETGVGSRRSRRGGEDTGVGSRRSRRGGEDTGVGRRRSRRGGEDTDELFAPITEVSLLAGPDECVLLHRPDCDTAIPSELARVALADAPGVRAVVVQGLYEHVNFVLDPQPWSITVREVVPPRPAKLVDQARRIVGVTEGWPPLRLDPEVVDLADLARAHPSGHYLLPCRGGGAEIPDARLSYLDERPEPADWTLLGCERSRQIHRWFYGTEPHGPDLCPRAAPASGPLLTKCCLQQEELCSGVTDQGAPWASVPWGSSLDTVREAIDVLVRHQEPPWSPA